MKHALLAVGGLLCLTNFYLSFLRVPLLLRRGQPREEIRFVSGLPVLGSLLVLVALLLGLDGIERIAAWSLLVIDTGGLHWFAFSMALDALHERRRGS